MPMEKSPLGLRWVLLHNHSERAYPMETHSFAGSRSLVKGTYSPDTHLLRLWFTSSPDRAYDYPRVPEHIWTGLKAARSPGGATTTITSEICTGSRTRKQIHGYVDSRARPGEIDGPTGVGRQRQVWPIGGHASAVEVELAARKQQHVAHIGQVGVGGPRARFSSPRRSPRTMRREQCDADQDQRHDQRTREDDGEMCHAPVSALGRPGANPKRGRWGVTGAPTACSDPCCSTGMTRRSRPRAGSARRV